GTPGPLACNSCHVNMATDPVATGSHKLHAGTTGNAQYDCSVCHGTGYTISGVTYVTHNDQTINTNFTGRAFGTVYSDGSGPAGNGYGNCTTSNCHGNGTQNWSENTATPTCEKCHGSAATAALGSFKDTSGSTAGPNVGSHVSHLASSHNWMNDVTCDECHQTTVNNMAAQATMEGKVNAAGHIDSFIPAELSWGLLATNDGVLSPNYDGNTCSVVYCHGEGLRGGTNKTPSWGDLAYLSGTAAQKCGTCHGYPPTFPHSTNTNCYTCHDHVNTTNNGFVDVSKHVNSAFDISADLCIDCHGDLSAHHLKHTDASILIGKSLATGDWEGSWVYSTTYSADGMPKFACGICHSATLSLHRNGIVELDLDPSHTSDPLSIKAKNRSDASFTQVTGVSVTCNGIYCHSNGRAPYLFRTTPDWYTDNPWASVDKCAQCHGNSPGVGIEGSSAHAIHVVGIHYKDIFSSTSGKMAQGGATGAAHGDPNAATTINCNICHNTTVTASYNDKNTICVTCHDGAIAPTKGAADIAAGSTAHINGQVDVSFGTFSLKSRAQVRDNITTVPELNNAWTRTNGYKATTSYDLSKRQPSYDLGTCSSIDCHNSTPMQWNAAGPLSCNACHKGTPQ
ncbi:MAG: CxxxxCH/CxxCH domain-containing protein, partial [Thermodesulfovibrionales bacterium]